jgi:hypothetical protein
VVTRTQRVSTRMAEYKHQAANRPEGAPEREISVESEYSVGDARFVCFRLVTGGDSGRDVSTELYRRPAAEVEIAAGAPPVVTPAPEGEEATNVEPGDAAELKLKAYVRVTSGKIARQKGFRGKVGEISWVEEENTGASGKVKVSFDATTAARKEGTTITFERAHLRIVRGPPFAEAVAPAGAASSSAEGQDVGAGGGAPSAEQPKKRFVLNQLVKVEVLEEKQKKKQRKFLFRHGKVAGVPGSKDGQTYQIAFTEKRNGAELGAKITRKFLGRNLVEAEDLQEPDKSEEESESEDDGEGAPQEVDSAQAQGRKRKAVEGAADGSRGKKRVVAPDVEENNALATSMEEEEEEKIYGGMIRALRLAKSSRSSGGVASEDDIGNCKEALGRVHSVFLDAMMAKEEGNADGIPEEVDKILGMSMCSELRRCGEEGIVAAVNAIITGIQADMNLTSDFYPAPLVAEVQA